MGRSFKVGDRVELIDDIGFMGVLAGTPGRVVRLDDNDDLGVRGWWVSVDFDVVIVHAVSPSRLRLVSIVDRLAELA